MTTIGSRLLAGVLRKGFLLSGAFLFTSVTVAAAGDWSASTRFSQSVEANDNRPLDFTTSAGDIRVRQPADAQHHCQAARLALRGGR